MGAERFIRDRENKKKPGSLMILQGHFLNDLKTSHEASLIKISTTSLKGTFKIQL